MSGAAHSTEELWKLLSDRLRGFFSRRVSDPDAVEDLLQETFLRIHRGLAELDDGQRIVAWVFQVARNLVVDYHRSRPEVAPEDQGAETEEHAEESDANLNDEVRAWLPAMIAGLPETYRRALELSELEGLSQQRVADELGLSLSGAKSRVQRGRGKLKDLLFDCCSFERDSRGNVIDYSRNDPGSCSGC